jgi:ATP adenylyltransferase
MQPAAAAWRPPRSFPIREFVCWRREVFRGGIEMEQLWAPWRLSYVASAKAPAEGDPCFICQGLAAQDDRCNLIALRTPLSVVVLNRFPYNNGHLLVAPRAHKGRLDELSPDEVTETQLTLGRMVDVLDGLMHPDGYNIGLNLGRVAGAGLPGHLHWHIVPRWSGDTNFMPVLGDVKVIVQSLDALYDLLVEQLGAKR